MMFSNTKPKVLVAEDHANWRSLLVQLLDKEFDVAVAQSYEEARTLLSKQHPAFHVLVADLRLDDRDTADENGLALAEELKRLGVDTKVIVVTGFETYGTMERAYQDLAVYKYLLKNPGKGQVFDHHTFVQLVREAASLVEKDRRRFVFVLMPFGAEYRTIYDKAIRPTVEKHGFACRRADDSFQPNRIVDEIRSGIKGSVFNVADFSGRNPNVFYDVGLAHSMRRPTLLLTQRLIDAPRFLRQFRHIVYRSDLDESGLAHELDTAIRTLDMQGYAAASIFHSNEFKPDASLCVLLTDYGEAESKDAYKYIVEPVVKECGLSLHSSTNEVNNGAMLDDIWTSINCADLVIVDLSCRNPDVYYLLGLADGLSKEVVFLARSTVDIPYYLEDRDCILYSTEKLTDGENSKQSLRVFLKKLTRQGTIRPSSKKDDPQGYFNEPTKQTSIDPTEHEQIARKIRELVVDDMLDEALDELGTIPELVRDVDNLRGRLNKEKNKRRKQTITEEEYSVQLSRIEEDIQELLEDICPP